MRARAFIGPVQRDGSNYLDVIRAGLRFTDFGSAVSRQTRVFVKPNLTFPSYRPGVMTSPAAVEAAIQAIREHCDEVWMGDADSGGYYPFSMDEVYRTTGMIEFAARHGVRVVNLSRLERGPVRVRSRHRLMEFELPRLLTNDIDMLITMPVPKVHLNTGVSLTLKNQWGCIPVPADRLRLHPHFGDVVIAVNQLVKTKWAIIDGRFGLTGSGPLRGVAVELGWVCVTDNYGAGARIACELMGIDLSKIAHLRLAQSHGLVPELYEIECNDDLARFQGPKFVLRRQLIDWPGYLAFHHPVLAQIAYFSRWSELLHRLLYLFREPFYDHDRR